MLAQARWPRCASRGQYRQHASPHAPRGEIERGVAAGRPAQSRRHVPPVWRSRSVTAPNAPANGLRHHVSAWSVAADTTSQPANTPVRRRLDRGQSALSCRALHITVAYFQREWGCLCLTTAAGLIGIVLFCADVSISTIGCSDYSLRNFPLAIRRRAAI